MVSITPSDGMHLFDRAKIIVIKVGSSLLVDDNQNAINTAWLKGIAGDIAALKEAGKHVVVVSSGAIALGSRLLNIQNSKLKLQEKQAAAAAGQVLLAHAWMEALGAHKVQTAQILLSPDDTETRRKHINARTTMLALLQLGAVPVVNENDTVATAEIRFGDNDRLAARVAGMIGADMLVLLSDVDGLYTANPNGDGTATHLSKVPQITPDIMAMAGPANAAFASGGMVTKLEAARIATSAGCQMIICNGQNPGPLARLQTGAKHTLFTAMQSPHTARKQWIAGSLTPKGKICIDDGAVTALENGRSLLPAGVISVTGQFDRGDLIEVENNAGVVIGRGLSSYSSDDAMLICGHKSNEIKTVLGYHGRDEMIHADNLVISDT
ncbi:glutamate 5-kinase [Candidatus Puniceispirillum sp.]|nr:glutamate 5-kinase [Candidatus Puniceispirillum sp.]